MTKHTPKRPKGTPSWVNSRVSSQNKKLVREANAASKSRGLIKARIRALTAKVSLMESEISSIMRVLGEYYPDAFKHDGIQAVEERKAIQTKLLQAAESLGPEEE